MKANCFKVLWGVVAILTRIQAFQGKLINHFDVQEKDAQTKGGAGNPVNVQALIRNTALIPCDLTPPLANDSVVLVVWYKDGNAPIYSFDVRGPYATMAKHWKSVNLEHRAFFRTMTDPATLSIDNISEVDEGEYRCRIDYQRAATRNYRARLTVIVPPSKPTILNENGKEVLEYAGPYEEGGDMKLKCMVTGGKPRPTIKWWREGKLLESTDGGHGDGGGGGGSGSGRSSQLVVRGLRRADQHAAFTCQAANNNISQPVSATASIEIYFRPLSVEILTSDNPFSAERKYEIPCQTFGSRPPAKIIWLLDNKELTAPKYNFTQTNSEDGNSSLSSLTFVPSRQDNDKTITCRATNHLVHSGTEEATIKLNVEYVPILHLSLGSNLNPEDIEEGDDVYFECKVNANPEAYKVLWKHNGQIMHGNQKNGVIMSASALVLQVVSRTQSGNYSCVASNVEGDGESNVVDLKIMYKPICRAEQKRVYGVARHEAAAVRCDVESYPPPDAFRWSFNNSAESTEVPPTKFTAAARHFSSVLTYAPVTELDYGTVMCWASNLAGRQQEPCIFHIIAAGKPDPLYNCSIINRSNESLEVECIAGFDGGQQQYFLLEVYDHKSGVLQTNLSSTFPLFVVSGLDPGKELKMVIYSANGKGRSDPVTLEGYTLKAAEKQTVLSLGTRDQLEFAPVLGILVGIVSALLLVTVVILAALRVRSGSRREGPRGALRPGFLPVKDKVNHPPLRLDQDDVFEKDDKNPDVIPSNKDSDYQLGSAVQTPGPNHVLSSSVAAPDYDTAAPTPQVMAHSPPPQSVTPLAEAYLARDRAYVPQHLSNEVIYAELSLSRPNSLDAAVKNGGQQYEPSTIYTQIDHARRPPPLLPPKTSPLLSPVTSLFPPKQGGLYHREVVTVRTPLMGCQQESCV